MRLACVVCGEVLVQGSMTPPAMVGRIGRLHGWVPTLAGWVCPAHGEAPYPGADGGEDAG